MKIKVYAKLSVEEREVRRILPNAKVAAPIQRDDLLNDIDRGINVIAIIDGKFDQVCSVSASEIMDALRCGVRVYGSSSMGALRAAELDSYGMIGVGEIYELIRSSAVFRDDFLGQVFVDADQSQHSYAYVDFFFNAKKLVGDGGLTPENSKKLCRAYAELHFSERGPAALLSFLKQTKLHSSPLIKSAETIFKSRFRQKRADAIELLKTIKRDLKDLNQTNERIIRDQMKSKDPFNFYPSGLFHGFRPKEYGP